MLVRLLIVLGLVLGIYVSLGAIKALQIMEAASQSFVQPPEAVTTVTAERSRYRPEIEAIGTFAAVEGVSISSEQDGQIVEIAVENGALVAAGDPILRQDTSVEAAQLEGTLAQLSLARINLKRAEEMLATATTSRSTYDSAAADVERLQAEAEGVRAVIAQKSVRAPFAGRVGIRHVNLGQYVNRGQALVPLFRLDPIFLNFSVPQRLITRVQPGQEVAVTVDAYPDRTFTGRINALNPQVDAATRNVAVQATLANPDENLRPGMFARVAVQLEESEPLIFVPATAVSFSSYGNSIYIVETMKGPDGTEYTGARQAPVRLGPTRGDQIAILSGVKEGETVVSSGVFKLRNGIAVRVENVVTPANSPAPQPANT